MKFSYLFLKFTYDMLLDSKEKKQSQIEKKREFFFIVDIQGYD